MNKEFNKIRKLLGNEYHLSETISINGIKWVLYKRYKDSKVYFSKDNEPIMSSDTHTLEQLKEYAKTHHKIDYGMLMTKIYIFIALINFISVLANFLNRNISSVYNSIRILKKKKTKDLVLKDSAGEKHLIITEDELNGKMWYK